MSQLNPPRILTIAGSDSGGGAGIQADLKTIAALGGHGMSAITALTAQNTIGVSLIEPVSVDMVSAQIDMVAEDIGVDAAKIGMLADGNIVRVVAAALERNRIEKVVVDPVLRSTTGADLGGEAVRDAIIARLFPLAALITPNLHECGVLLGEVVERREQMAAAALRLIEMGCSAVLLKGGHLPDAGDEEEVIADLLMTADGVKQWFEHARISTRNVHGTGCTLSAAIATYLGRDLPLVEAVEHGIGYVQGAIAAGVGLRLGQGAGPLWHAWVRDAKKSG
ncbi:MAG: bifunctional hydroxymethylpyrimidine kinase/phosphomethylpyrimidine kinase [Candidatus Protistobacter heckmanni]|nr:bifunctional hydroxymethylpyrimidine kinase/phosphomethylpyrimidine kinase [Candidatus Protistobacter heckmanni]